MSTNKKTKREVKLRHLPAVWQALHGTIPFNENPFAVQGQRMLFELQPDIQYLSKLSKEDFEALGDLTKTYNALPVPSHYGQEHVEGLNFICNEEVKPKKSYFQELAEKEGIKTPTNGKMKAVSKSKKGGK